MPSYSQYKRQLAVLDADDTDIEAWITVKGNHIPIKKGQSKEEAVKSFIESKNGGGKGASVPKDEVKKSGTTSAYANAAKERDGIIKQLRGSMTGKERMRLENRKKTLENTMVKESNKGSELREELRREENVKNSGGKSAEPKMSKSDRWEKYHREKGNIKEGRPPKDWTKVEGALTAPNGYTWYSNNKSMFGGERESYLYKDEPKSNKSTFYKNVSGKQFGTPSGRTIIENELLTEKEMQKYGADPTSEKFEKKDLGKKDHHYFFGARFETPKNKMSKPSDSDMSGGSINNIFNQANAGLQSFVDDTGYQPQTTFWSDFGIAEPFGEKAVEDTYNRAFREWKNDKVYLTELSMMLNWKLWQHYDKGNEKMARLYDKLWKQTDKYAMSHLKGDDLQYYIRTTD